MKLQFTGTYSGTPRFLLQRCGYKEEMNRKGERNYVRRLGGEFPRFHAYIDLTDGGFQVNLHLDQKQPTYGEHTAHSGEYDGPVVEQEGMRIRALIEGQKRTLA